MKAIPNLPVMFLLFLICSALSAQDNPFMKMADKKYAEYSEDLYNEILLISISDTTDARKIIDRIVETAYKTGKTEWKLLVAYAELELFRRKFELYGNDFFPIDELLKKMWLLLEEAKKANVNFLELIVRQKIIECYWDDMKNYELAFEQYRIQEERLQSLSSDDIPEIADYLIKIANAHYYFRDYTKAVAFYNRVLEVKDNDRTPYPKQHARNGLGLSYHYGYNDLDRSDSCFHAILQVTALHPEESDRYKNNWTGISQGNLGSNMLVRGEYDKALPLLKSSLEIMLKENDNAFASGVAANLAKACIKKGNIEEAKYYIDLAMECNLKMPRNIIWSRIYEAMNKYYAAVGNTALSMAYMDSTLQMINKIEAEFDAVLLLRMEQKESLARQYELDRETVKRKQMQLRLLILSVCLVSIFGLLGWVYILYRKRNAAYRELVRKSQEWAYEKVESKLTENADRHNNIEEADRKIYGQFQLALQNKYLYREPAISIEDMAGHIKVNRNYLSRAINRCAGKNFNSCINEYRIKEAVRLIMDSGPKKFSIEEIAYKVGFDERKTFYNSFKKMTGLSPTQFKVDYQKMTN